MQEEGGEVRSRVAPGLGSCKKNCGVSSLFLAFEQEGVKREEGTGAGRKGEAREWIMKGKKNPSNSSAEGERAQHNPLRMSPARLSVRNKQQRSSFKEKRNSKLLEGNRGSRAGWSSKAGA